jgi:hypothetical protein
MKTRRPIALKMANAQAAHIAMMTRRDAGDYIPNRECIG